MLTFRSIKKAAGLFTGLSALGAVVGCAKAAPAPAPKPVAASPKSPNVVVILVDDMGWADLGCYGSEISTPNLDKLAAGGLRFTQFYNTARCSPSRACLMTGLYPHEAGMGYLDNLVIPGSEGTTGRLSDRAVTMAQVLSPKGYFTGMTGKWHMGQNHGSPPWQRGFQHSVNSPAGGIYFPNQKGKGKQIFIDGKGYPSSSPVFGQNWYSSDLWTKYTVQYIDEAVKEKKPFFLYQAFCAPHFPLMAKEQDIAKYRGKYMAGWDKLRVARHEKQIKLGVVDPKWPLSARPPASPAWDSLSAADKKMFDEKMSVYAAMIDNMDQNVGKIVDNLKKRGVLDNTLILFMSDNGGNAESGPTGTTEGDHLGDPNSNVFLGMNWATLANTPFRRYKHFTHEGGISTPLIAHWPAGIPKSRDGKLEKQPGHLVDIMATVVDVTGAKYPSTFNGKAIHPMDGVSLLPAFQGKTLKRTAPIFWEHEGNRGIRSGPWKLVSKFLEPWELYNIDADRTEQHDLVKQKPEMARAMAAQWDKWAGANFVDQWKGRIRNDWGGEKKGPGAAAGEEGEDEAVVNKAMQFDLKAGMELDHDQGPQIGGKEITITATLGAKHGNGVIVAQGGLKAGYALYVKDGKLELATRIGGEQRFVTSPNPLPAGPVTVTGSLVRGGTYILQVAGKEVATLKEPALIKTQPLDGLQVGSDAGGLVGRYEAANNFDGDIQSVHIELKG